MNDFNVTENAGSGFDLDDSEDLESMFGKAAGASEDSGDLTGLSSEDLNRSQRTQMHEDDDVSAPPASPAPAVQAEPEPESGQDSDELETIISEIEHIQGEAAEHATPAAVPANDANVVASDHVVIDDSLEKEIAIDPAPQPTELPKDGEKLLDDNMSPNASTSSTSKRVKVPSEAEQIESVERIIRILDAYRNLTAEEKSVAIQFVTDGELDSAEDEVVVVKVMNADPLLTKTMLALEKAYELDAVERAFFAVSLDSKTLHALGGLVSVFSSVDYDENQSNIDYSRQVVADITKLDEREIGFVKATGRVLAAAGEVD